jgi:hypothetical protein
MIEHLRDAARYHEENLILPSIARNDTELCLAWEYTIFGGLGRLRYDKSYPNCHFNGSIDCIIV